MMVMGLADGQNLAAQAEESLAELHKLLESLRKAEQGVEECTRLVRNATDALGQAEAAAIMDGIEGKNETERKASLRLKLAADPAYAEAQRLVAAYEASLSTEELRLSAIKHEMQYHRVRLDVAIARLNFLASLNK